SAIDVKRFIIGMATFVQGGEQERAKAGPRDFVGSLEVEPKGSIAPGETKDLTLTVASNLFSTERLIPTNDPQQFIGGIMQFANAKGDQQLVTVRSGVAPTKFRSQFLP